MRITRHWLESHGACSEGKEWFLNENVLAVVSGIKNLIAKDKLSWANWLLVRVLTSKQRIAYSIFAAEQVIITYEKLYPNDNRPRLAIEAAKAVLRHNTAANRSAAESAAESARSAAESARSAARSAESAAESARSAARSAAESARSAESAWSSAWSAESAAWSAWSSAWSAESAWSSAWSAMLVKILTYGLTLLERGIK